MTNGRDATRRHNAAVKTLHDALWLHGKGIIDDTELAYARTLVRVTYIVEVDAMRREAQS